MRNVLTLLGTRLLAGCCLMHFHVPITEQTRTNAQTFGSLGQRLLPDGTPPERIAAFRQCLSVAYMGHYGEGEAGAARECEDGYALFWQTVMVAAPTYGHLVAYDIHARGRKRYEADPRSFVEAGGAWARIVFERCGAGVFPDEDRYRMLSLFSHLPVWCDPLKGVPPSPRHTDGMGALSAAGPQLP